MTWSNGAGLFYEGDCQPGDRAATDDELAAWRMTLAAPTSISRAQFFEQIAREGVLSADEAVAAAAGTIPDKLMALIVSLPPNLQLSARIKVVSAASFERANAIVTAMGAAFGWDGKKLDQVWLDASKL